MIFTLFLHIFSIFFCIFFHTGPFPMLEDIGQRWWPVCFRKRHCSRRFARSHGHRSWVGRWIYNFWKGDPYKLAFWHNVHASIAKVAYREAKALHVAYREAKAKQATYCWVATTFSAVVFPFAQVRQCVSEPWRQVVPLRSACRCPWGVAQQKRSFGWHASCAESRRGFTLRSFNISVWGRSVGTPSDFTVANRLIQNRSGVILRPQAASK